MLAFDPPYDWVPALCEVLTSFNTCPGTDAVTASVMGLVDSAEALRAGINKDTVRIDWKLPMSFHKAYWANVQGLVMGLECTAARFVRAGITTVVQKHKGNIVTRHTSFRATASFPGDPVEAHAQLMRLAQHLGGVRSIKYLEGHVKLYDVWSFRARVTTFALARGWRVGRPHASGRLPFTDTMSRQGTVHVRPRDGWAKLLLGLSALSIPIEVLHYPTESIRVAVTDIEGEDHEPAKTP